MAETELGNLLGVVDKRYSPMLDGDPHLRVTRGVNEFTTNAAGTATTLVGDDPDPGEGLRIGDKFKIFTSAGVLKEETVFRVTSAASETGTTTYTFTPAAGEAPGSGAHARLVSLVDHQDVDNMDRRLTAIGYTAAQLRQMNANDKMYALRVEDDSVGI